MIKISAEARRVARRFLLEQLGDRLPALIAPLDPLSAVLGGEVVDDLAERLADELAGDALDALFESVLGTSEVEVSTDRLELDGVEIENEPAP